VVYLVNTSGYGSFGDDSYAETLKGHLAQTWPASKIVVNRLGKTPFSPDASEAVVLGGGGILYRHTYDGGSDTLKHFLRYPASAQIFGKKTLALSLGVQGALKSEHLGPYVDVLNAMNVRTVRDSRSAAILRDAGVSAPVIESADLSYCVCLPEPARRKSRTKPVLGVAVSQPDKGVIYDETPGFENRVLDALLELHREFDIHFYSFDRRSDRTVHAGWSGSHQISHYEPAAPDAVGRFLAAMRESDLFLTSRLHGVIFSARMGIPFVSIGAPDEKVERESQALRHSFHLRYSTNTAEIVESVRNAWAVRAQSAVVTQEAVAVREAMAMKTLEALHSCN